MKKIVYILLLLVSVVSCKTSQKIKSENPNYKPLEYGFEEKSKMTGVYKTRKRAAMPSFLNIYVV